MWSNQKCFKIKKNLECFRSENVFEIVHYINIIICKGIARRRNYSTQKECNNFKKKRGNFFIIFSLKGGRSFLGEGCRVLTMVFLIRLIFFPNITCICLFDLVFQMLMWYRNSTDRLPSQLACTCMWEISTEKSLK